MREAACDKGRLEDILQAIHYVNEFVADISYEQLIADKMRYFAIVKNLEIIGEAAYMLTKEFIANHNSTPWNVIIKMRHVLVHGYTNIEPDILWDTIKNDLPPFKSQVESYLKEF